jgi:LytS/YehU family sensor histidine kinase
LDSALSYSIKALEIQVNQGLEGDIMHTCSQIGSIYESQGKLEKAREYYAKSLQHSQWVVENKSFYSAKNIGWYIAPQNVSASFEEQGLLAMVDAHQGLYRINKAMGDFKASTLHLEQIIKTNQRLEELNKDKEVLELNTKYETERKEQQILLLETENELAQSNVRQTRTLLFGISGILMVILLMVLLYLRQNRLKAEQDKIILQQRLFRSQMNPHFLYNALASIQNFIITEDPDNASIYLSRFASLVRSILDSSNEEFIPLEQELELIENYLALQKVRYDEKFDYAVEADEGIDPEILEVPPMLTQPFIENAILHGIKPKKGKGRVIVRLRRLNDWTIFEVEDDGIGRAKSQEIRLEKPNKHKSLATSITRQRIAALNKKHRLNISMEIIDLTDETGKASGTLVSFRIPMG